MTSMMLYGMRLWWIWWCEPTDALQWIHIRIRASSILFIASEVLAISHFLTAMFAGKKTSLIYKLLVTYFVPIIGLLLNLINGVRLLRLWYVYFRITKTIRRRMRHEDQVFNTVFAAREGYSEARQEMEAAGIDPSELDEIQRMEVRNVRRALSHFGSRALQNINMMRMIFNIDGDRDPDDTEENRIILFTKITSLPYNKEKHGEHESCTICCSEFIEGKYIKMLPKCSHIFHEDCIEGWILKAKHRMICCPICRTNIKEEIDIEDQQNAIEAETNEDFKSPEMSEGQLGATESNLLDLTEVGSQNVP
eukprot:CAMPEP_0196995890 /NCGR_PEP_ID=MMETSP1380-20130617/1903_1 /TAXON_ID=5936 /ORGANISM="Euplotes crassus, Strain CT5" /LENGTH=307 /DNA_ID=CAMNT_0042411693 /DNA_START=169 /DNA_END=1088 /DNA_ORIENTATION=+